MSNDNPNQMEAYNCSKCGTFVLVPKGKEAIRACACEGAHLIMSMSSTVSCASRMGA